MKYLIVVLLFPVFAFATELDDRFITIRNGQSLRGRNVADTGFFPLVQSGTTDSPTLTNHITTHMTAPTATVNSNAGTGGTCSLVNATDTAGTILLTTVVDAILPDNTTGPQCAVTFNTVFANAPACVLTASGVNPDATTSVGPYIEKSTTALTLEFNGSSFMAGTYAYSFDYICIGTQ